MCSLFAHYLDFRQGIFHSQAAYADGGLDKSHYPGLANHKYFMEALWSFEALFKDILNIKQLKIIRFFQKLGRGSVLGFKWVDLA